MNRSRSPTERRRLNKVAREYTDKGYRVIKEPTPESLPDFLTGLHPAMIAHADHEHVAVAIETTDSLPQSRDLVLLAAAIDPRADWRLELHVVGSSPDRNAAVLEWWEIKRRLADARELLASQEAAALLLASAAAEAAARLIAKRNDVRLRRNEQDTPFATLRLLYSIGLVEHDDYRAIVDGARLRNLTAHGYRGHEPTRDSTIRMIEGVEHLLNEIPAQIAS